MNINIREANLEDFEDLAKLVVEFWKENSRLLGHEPEVDEDEIEEEVLSYLKSSEIGYFIAVDEETDDIVGFRRWALQDDFYFSRELFVLQSWRRKGIAKKLIRHFENWLQDEKNQDMACMSIIPKNKNMLKLARSEGYDILNTVELRKNLAEDVDEPENRVEFLDEIWKIF